MLGSLFTVDSLLAYIDPGTGYALWLALAAAGTGLLYQMRRVREKVVGFFRRKGDA